MSSSGSGVSDSTDAGQPLVGVLAVVGVGLIGGSFAAALRRAGVVGRVLGVGRDPSSLQRARKSGLIDEVVSIEEAARQADLIFLSVPVAATADILTRLLPCLRKETLITDAGSTKVDVVAAARSVLAERVVQFVPGHPIAGSEATGPEAADADLYQGRAVILTPFEENTEAERQYLRQVWEACGARVVLMSPTDHDATMASVSHMPHFLASVFMGQVASGPQADLRLALAGTGFRDFTRIAAGSPEIWRDIFLANRQAILAELNLFRTALEQAATTLESENATGLHDFLERAALARRFWASRSGLI